MAKTSCSIEKTLDIVGDRWSLLILREALVYKTTRFASFQSILKIAPNILTARLDTIVAAGILYRREYKDAGSRSRMSYHPTPKGEDLKVVLAALQQWGDEHVPPAGGPTVRLVTADQARPLRVGFVDGTARPEPLTNVVFERTDNWFKAAGMKNPSEQAQ